MILKIKRFFVYNLFFLKLKIIRIFKPNYMKEPCKIDESEILPEVKKMLDDIKKG